MNSAASDSSRVWNKAPVAAVALYLLCAVLLGFPGPGMNNDEAVFFNGAVQMVNSGQEPTFAHDPWSWVTISGRRWPLMVLPYAGALRGYLALLPFALFGSNYYTARVVTMLVGAFALWGFSVLVRGQANARTAALTGFILAIHPAYLTQTIYDQGGVAEWMAPFGVLSLTLTRYLRSPTSGSAFWVGAAVGFGGWSRANIAWLVGSAALAGIIVLGKRMSVRWDHFAGMAAGGIVGGAPLVWYEIRSRGATFGFMESMNNPLPLIRLVGHRLFLLAQTFLSDSEHRDMWDGPELPLWQTLLFSAVVLFALYVCLAGDRPSKQEGSAFGRVAAWTFLFLLSCMLVSRFNVSDHHMIALIPIAAVLVVIAAQQSCRRWPRARYAVGAIGVLYFASALQWNLAAARQIRSTGGVRLWSNAIDSVSGYLQRNHSERPVKVVDWGFQHSLFVLSNSKISSTELFWGASVERSGSGKLWRDEISPGDIYVLHLKGLILFPEATEGFSRALAASAHPLRRTQFREKGGAPYAEVVEVLIPAGSTSN